MAVINPGQEDTGHEDEDHGDIGHDVDSYQAGNARTEPDATEPDDPNEDIDVADENSLSPGLVRLIREWGVVLVVALTVAIVVRAFVFSPFYIPSSSMEPGLQINDRILVNKLSYKLHDMHREDVVVFDAPPGVDFGPNVKDLVKRIIGLPGDTLEIRDCSVFVNGIKLDEPYVALDATGQRSCTTTFSSQVDPDGNGTIQVPTGDVFVMGDNRGNSDDGRTWGFLDQSLILGRAFVIYWPLSHWSWL